MQETLLDKQITPRQYQVLKQLQSFEASQCYSATIAELAQEIGVSRPTVFEHIAALRKKGLISKSQGRARSLRLTPQASRLLEAQQQTQVEESYNPDQMQLYGRVAAGMPIEAIENAEPISLTSVFGSAGDTFVLEVAGDSMIGEGIYEGDYVVCKSAKTAHDGQLVVAIVEDDNATLKRFYRESDRIRLQPANDAYEPIYTNNCRIEAVVLGLLRRL